MLTDNTVVEFVKVRKELAVLRRTAIPMDRDEIDIAACTLLQEQAKPSLSGITACNGRASETETLSFQRGDVCSVGFDGFFDCHAACSCAFDAEVGFVEGEDLGPALLFGGSDVVEPDAGQIGVGGPEHGDELDEWVQVARGFLESGVLWGAVPVVRPGDLGCARCCWTGCGSEEVCHGGIIVCETTLADARCRKSLASRGSCGR